MLDSRAARALGIRRSHAYALVERDAVVRNALASRAWSSFTDRVQQVTLPHVLGLTVRECAGLVRVSFAKVAEFQRRGAVHFHAVVRLDGACGLDERPPVEASVEALARAVARHNHLDF